MHRALCLGFLIFLLPGAPPMAAEEGFSLAGTWLDTDLVDSVSGDAAYNAERRVVDFVIDGHRFDLDETGLAEISARLGAPIRRSVSDGEADIWLCLTTADQAVYVYSHGLAEKDPVNKLVLDNRGRAPVSAGCANRDAPLALDMPIPAPGISLAAVQDRYGLVMPADTGSFGYGTLSLLDAEGKSSVWQEIVYHTTDGMIDAYGLVQIRGD